MNVKSSKIFIPNTTTTHISLVRQDHRRSHRINRDSGTLIVIANRRDDRRHFGRVTSHIVENTPGHHRTGLGMIFTVYQVANIMEITGNLRQFYGPFIMTHRLQNITCCFRHMNNMGKAMFCKAQCAQRLISTDNICFDCFAFCDFFISQHILTSF